MTSRARATSVIVGNRTPDSGSTSGSADAADLLGFRVAIGVTPASPVTVCCQPPSRALTRYSHTSMLAPSSMAALSQERRVYVQSEDRNGPFRDGVAIGDGVRWRREQWKPR